MIRQRPTAAVRGRTPRVRPPRPHPVPRPRPVPRPPYNGSGHELRVHKGESARLPSLPGVTARELETHPAPAR